MYGLLLENLSEYIKKMYGEDRWEEIRRMANVDQPSFSVHQVYCETLIPRLAKKSQEVLFTFNYIHKKDSPKCIYNIINLFKLVFYLFLRCLELRRKNFLNKWEFILSVLSANMAMIEYCRYWGDI